MRKHSRFLQAIITSLLNRGANAHEDASFLVSILSDEADLLAFFRAEFLAAIREKAGNPTKARKIFLSLGKTSRQIFGPEFARVRADLDKESKAARQSDGINQ